MPRIRIHIALFTVAFLFSLNYLISRLGMREFAPLSFAWLRVVGSALLLAFFARRDPSPPLTREQGRKVAGFAILGVVINQTFFLTGLSFTTIPVAAILITTIPVFAAGGAIALGRERASWNRVGGIILAGAGALLVVHGESLQSSRHSFLGATLIILNCLSFAMYLVVSKPAMAQLSARRVVARMFAVGSVLLLPVCAWSLWREDWKSRSAAAWLALLLVILGPTVAAYLLNAWALRFADSSLVAAYTYVQPVLASLLGAIFLGEHIHGTLAVAGVMIFAGVWLAGRTMSGGNVNA
jgi:drug/metabolite transporter (DMT)-like permease